MRGKFWGFDGSIAGYYKMYSLSLTHPPTQTPSCSRWSIDVLVVTAEKTPTAVNQNAMVETLHRKTVETNISFCAADR